MCQIVLYSILFLFAFFLIFIQYTILSLGIMKENLSRYIYLVNWIPFVPYLIVFLVTVTYLIMKIFKGFVKWFEMNWGWFFVNGRKQDAWGRYLRDKYEK